MDDLTLIFNIIIFSLIACFVAGLILIILGKQKGVKVAGICLMIFPIFILIVFGAVCGKSL